MTGNSCLDDFQSQIEFNRLRLADYPNIIFLCGGEVKNGSRPKSLRHKLLDEIANKRPVLRKQISLAEDVFHQFDHTTYSDLLSFEKDLANFCSITVVIAESAGSIAELGAFSVLENVSDKIVIILEDKHYRQRSFIRRGPVEYIKNSDDNRVLSYKWRNEQNKLTNILFDTMSKDLINDIETLSSSFPNEPIFDQNNSGHVMLLITGIIGMGQALKFEEISNALHTWGVIVKKHRLSNLLSLLVSLNFIRLDRYSSYDYYTKEYDGRCVRWSFKKGAALRDTERWRIKFREYYQHSDKKRFNAIKNLY